VTVSIPCIRHGDASTADPRLIKALDIARGAGLFDIEARLESLLDYDGQLWATWRTLVGRDTSSAALSQAWKDVGGERGALHLLRSDDAYDYQSDCMNDASV
jgi:hypothetical protein